VSSAEQLIALEAAQAELGTLYAVARSFTALHARAEAELLPRLTALGRRLRGLLRTAELRDDEVAAAAREILAVRTTWQAELQKVRTAPIYEQALAAFAADQQNELADLIPQVFAGLQRVRQLPPTLYFPVSPSSGRRRPGSSPFLSPPDCADRILRLLIGGLEPESDGAEWWQRELPSITCADSPAALDTPIALGLAASGIRLALFTTADEPSYQIFTPRLRAPMSIVLATEATDEWWEAYQDSYRQFRDALTHELAAHGYAATFSSA
jgi:hypothetical protein